MSTIESVEIWVSDKMKADMWYNIENGDLPIYKILIDEKYNWPKFQLSLSPDYKQVKKTEI